MNSIRSQFFLQIRSKSDVVAIQKSVSFGRDLALNGIRSQILLKFMIEIGRKNKDVLAIQKIKK